MLYDEHLYFWLSLCPENNYFEPPCEGDRRQVARHKHPPAPGPLARDKEEGAGQSPPLSHLFPVSQLPPPVAGHTLTYL